MATREAGIKLTLNSGSFSAGLSQIASDAKRTGASIKSSLNSAFKGVGGEMLKGGKSALKDLTSGLKSAVGMAASLGGALSIGAGAKGALEQVTAYKNLAFQISNGTGQAVKWQEVQADIQGTADRWKQTTEDVTAAYQALFDETGDLQFTADATNAVAMAATASGKSIASLAAIAGTLNEKFGIAGDEIEDALASVLELGSKGGVTVDDMGSKLGMVGASAKQMGLQGKAGFSQVIGMLNIGDNVAGSLKKNLAGVSGLMETFGNADKLKAAEKDLHVKLTDKSGAARKDALDTILAKSGGKEEILSKVFAGDTLKIVSDFGKTFQKTFAETEGTAKQKTEAALKAFHAGLEAAGKTSLTAAQVEADAKKRAAEDPERQFADAMNKFKTAFTKPEMLNAMNKLAALLPRVADGMAKLLGFVVDHPALAGAAVVGGKVGMGVIGGGLEKLGGNLAGMMGSAIASGGKSLAADITATLAGGAPSIGKAMGAAVGITAAAAIAVAIGQALIDARASEKNKDQETQIMAGIAGSQAMGKGDLTGMRNAKEQLQASKEKLLDGMANSPIDGIFEGLASAVDGDFKSQSTVQLEQTNKDLAALSIAIAEATDKMGKAAKGAGGLADETRKAGSAAKGAASAFFEVGGGSPASTPNNAPTKGPGGGPGNAPGHRWFD